jgi:hypothetical protein
MTLNDLHGILFNAHIVYSLALAVWSAVTAARGGSISGNFWGAVATSAILAGSVLLIGLVMMAQGLRVERTTIYILYMLWLIVVMPGLFSMLRGRDDREAAVAFSILCTFNFFVSISMWQRGLVGPWLPAA